MLNLGIDDMATSFYYLEPGQIGKAFAAFSNSVVNRILNAAF